MTFGTFRQQPTVRQTFPVPKPASNQHQSGHLPCGVVKRALPLGHRFLPPTSNQMVQKSLKDHLHAQRGACQRPQQSNCTINKIAGQVVVVACLLQFLLPCEMSPSCGWTTTTGKWPESTGWLPADGLSASSPEFAMSV